MEKDYDIKASAKHMDSIFKSASNCKFQGFISILNKLVSNIIKRPNEDKFRSVIFFILKFFKYIKFYIL